MSSRAANKVVAISSVSSVTSSSTISPENLKTWPTAQVVDALYRYHSRVEAFQPVLAAEKALEDELRRRNENEPADAILTVEGEMAGANLNARPTKRIITNPAKAFRIFRKYCEGYESVVGSSIGLSDIDRYVPEERHKDFLSESRAGKRRVDVFARPAEEMAVEIPVELPKAA